MLRLWQLGKDVIDRVGAVLKRQDGQDMVEYALIIGLISIVAVVAIGGAGDTISGLWDRVTAALADV